MTWKPCCERCSRFNSQQITFSVTLLVRDLKTMLWETFTVQQSTDYFFCNTFSPWLENHAVRDFHSSTVQQITFSVTLLVRDLKTMLWETFTVQQSTDYFFCNTFSPWLENHAVRDFHSSTVQQITFSVTLLVRDLKTMLWETFTVQQSTDYFFCNTFSPWLENHAVRDVHGSTVNRLLFL